jgi:Flp pilus assembly pilin Flp
MLLLAPWPIPRVTLVDGTVSTRGASWLRKQAFETKLSINGGFMQKNNTLQKKNEKGVTVVEYAIMLALIAIAVAVAAPNITSAVIGVFGKASSVMN